MLVTAARRPFLLKISPYPLTNDQHLCSVVQFWCSDRGEGYESADFVGTITLSATFPLRHQNQ